MTPSITHRKQTRHKIRNVIIPLLFWLVVWQLAATLVNGKVLEDYWRFGGAFPLRGLLEGQLLLLPGPIPVVSTLLALLGDGLFWRSVLASLLRILLGTVGGAVLGTALAVVTCRFPLCHLLLSPAIRVVRATPVASFIILILLWVKTGLVPGVISGLMVLPVLWGNVSQGITETDPLLLEAAGAYRFGKRKTARLLYLPAVLPYFTAGCNTALGLAWKAGVAAEVLCLPKLAIGTQVYFSKIYLETPTLFAWTAVVIVLSFWAERLLALLLRQLEGGRRL